MSDKPRLADGLANPDVRMATVCVFAEMMRQASLAKSPRPGAVSVIASGMLTAEDVICDWLRREGYPEIAARIEGAEHWANALGELEGDKH